MDPQMLEEQEKDAKRQRSAPTTPRSTSSISPHEYDEVMGITQVESLGSGKVWGGTVTQTLETLKSCFSLKKLLLEKLTLVRMLTTETYLGLGNSMGAFGSANTTWVCWESSPTACCCPCYPALWGRFREIDQPSTGYEPKRAREPASRDSSLWSNRHQMKCHSILCKGGKKRRRCDTEVRSSTSWNLRKNQLNRILRSQQDLKSRRSCVVVLDAFPSSTIFWFYATTFGSN